MQKGKARSGSTASFTQYLPEVKVNESKRAQDAQRNWLQFYDVTCA